jgi:hypothetical protein
VNDVFVRSFMDAINAGEPGQMTHLLKSVGRESGYQHCSDLYVDVHQQLIHELHAEMTANRARSPWGQDKVWALLTAFSKNPGLSEHAKSSLALGPGSFLDYETYASFFLENGALCIDLEALNADFSMNRRDPNRIIRVGREKHVVEVLYSFARGFSQDMQAGVALHLLQVTGAMTFTDYAETLSSSMSHATKLDLIKTFPEDPLRINQAMGHSLLMSKHYVEARSLGFSPERISPAMLISIAREASDPQCLRAMLDDLVMKYAENPAGLIQWLGNPNIHGMPKDKATYDEMATMCRDEAQKAFTAMTHGACTQELYKESSETVPMALFNLHDEATFSAALSYFYAGSIEGVSTQHKDLELLKSWLGVKLGFMSGAEPNQDARLNMLNAVAAALGANTLDNVSSVSERQADKEAAPIARRSAPAAPSDLDR